MTSRPRPPAPRWVTFLVIAVLIGVAVWEQRQKPRPAAEPAGPAASKSTDSRPPHDDAPASAPDSPRFELREVRRNVYESPAGLIYRSGGPDGHRIDHVLQHAKDDPSKPVHGVFDGERDAILATIDEAWELVQKRGPPTVSTEQEGDRTVYTVNLGREIGYLGGESGARRRHPRLRFLRLVVEDREVVTAFPVQGP